MSDGNYKHCRSGYMEELRPLNEYEYKYTAAAVWHMIRNKREIADKRNGGSFYYAEMLIDCEIMERCYLSNIQRAAILQFFERGRTMKETAQILGKTKRETKDIIASIELDLKRKMP